MSRTATEEEGAFRRPSPFVWGLRDLENRPPGIQLLICLSRCFGWRNSETISTALFAAGDRSSGAVALRAANFALVFESCGDRERGSEAGVPALDTADFSAGGAFGGADLAIEIRNSRPFRGLSRDR